MEVKPVIVSGEIARQTIHRFCIALGFGRCAMQDCPQEDILVRRCIYAKIVKKINVSSIQAYVRTVASTNAAVIERTRRVA